MATVPSTVSEAPAPRKEWLRAFWLTAALALAYYVSGRLGLLLAIPPGYATAVWPASGIALAAALIGGARVAPGIWVGSFVINVGTSFDAGAPVVSLLVPAAIAAGATAQALLGAYLIRRFVGYSNLLVQELAVIRMLLLGGPLACLLNPVVGVSALWLAGSLAPNAALPNLWTWWVGDSIGVLVFAPLVLVWTIRPYRAWLQRQLFVTVPLVALFATVVATFVFVSRREQARLEAAFEAMTTELGRGLEKELGNTRAALDALEGFFASSERVEQYHFEIFAGRLMHVLPAARALSWNPLVRDDERAAYERRTGRPITERGASGLQRALSRPYYTPVQFIVPHAGNDVTLGFDTHSEALRRAALEEAIDTGRLTASRRVTLVQSRGGEPGLLAVMPVYRNGVQPASIAARRRYVQGFAVAAFEIDRLLEATAVAARAEGYAVRLYDDGTPGAPVRLYDQAAPDGMSGTQGLHAEFRFDFAGRPLRMTLDLPAQALLAHRSWETWLVLAGGLVLVSLVGMLLLLGVGREARVVALVDERTRELRRLNADLTAQAERRARLESEADKRAAELADSNAELQRRAEINRQLLASLRHSESELRRTATQLASSNRELEQFAYVASHDLKAPLRSIGSFAQLLEKRHLDKLGDEGREFLSFIQEGIRQMQALIDDLLQLSRVDPRRLEPAQVAMNQVVERACRLLTADLKATGARVHCDALPDVLADGNMLVQLLQNLLGNALKFQQRGQTPEIWIDATAEADAWHFTVRDNGIGIDPAHLDHIFLVFKRLHTTDQFPGNGIGLAICKKVVTLHGGEIWAESHPGEGATFHFTLPRRLAADKAAA